LHSSSNDFESAILLADEGKFIEAKAMLNRLESAHSKDFRFSLYLGAIDLNLGRLKDAESHLKKSINQNGGKKYSYL
jgi:predicted Zn-dependent protease